MRREKPFDLLRLVIDLETAAIPDAATYVEPVTPPANYKDPAKIASYLVEKAADRLATAALDPDLNRIVAFGVMLEQRDCEPTIHLCRDDHEERQALRAFWDLVACEAHRTRTLISFNGFAFDFPTLLRRSLYLDVRPSRHLSLDRYRSEHIDLYQKLSFNGVIRAHSLRFYAQRLGLPIAAPELTGSDIAARVEAGDWTAVKDHCASDVEITYRLAARLGYLDIDDDEPADQDDAVGW